MKPYTTKEGMRIGCPEINVASQARFKALNGYTDADVDALRRYTLRQTDVVGWARR